MVSGGALLTATGINVSGNTGAGVRTGGAPANNVTLHDSILTMNGSLNHDPGFLLNAGTALIDGATDISYNVGPGVHQLGGRMTLMGGQGGSSPAIHHNGTATSPQDGVVVGSGLGFTADTVDVHDNTNHGFEITNQDSTNAGQAILIQNCTIHDNALTGLLVHASVANPNSSASLTVLGNTFTNGDHGIHLLCDLGSVWASIKGNTITGAANTGMVIVGTAGSSLLVSGNDLHHNSVLVSPGTRAAGGLLLTGVQPTYWSFTSNRMHSNASDQVLVAATAGSAPGTWDLSPGSAGCAAANVFACYGSGTTNPFVGLVSQSSIVDASGNSWQNNPPMLNIDYLLIGAGGITALPACAAVGCP